MAILYESFTESENFVASIQSDEWRSQTFTPTIAHSIERVELWTRKFGSPAGLCIIEIKAVDGSNHPTGAALATGSFTANDLTTSYVWKEIVFVSSTALDASTRYAIVASCPNGDGSNSVRWGFVRNGGTMYANGELLFSANGGSTWAGSGDDDDALFKDYGIGVAFPSDAITRVTSLTHRYDRGTYTLELNLGEVVADFGLPEWDSKPKKAIPTEEPPPPSIISPPVTPVTETGLPGVTMPFTTKMPTAAEMSERAGMSQPEYDKIIQQGKISKALEEFGPLTGPADLTKFKARYPELGIGVGAPKIGDPDYMARMGLLGAAAKAEADIKAAATTGPSLLGG